MHCYVRNKQFKLIKQSAQNSIQKFNLGTFLHCFICIFISLFDILPIFFFFGGGGNSFCTYKYKLTLILYLVYLDKKIEYLYKLLDKLSVMLVQVYRIKHLEETYFCLEVMTISKIRSDSL